MVSNSVKMDQREILAALKRLRDRHSDDPRYQELRKDLPKKWPI